ncbi:hypothetical protein TNCV_1662851 [Trichonephila clavipes]|nr:hypothetical protein TNCV_1662851 [Trichonephila clavipes]
MRETLVPSVEELIARISVADWRIRDTQGIFQNQANEPDDHNQPLLSKGYVEELEDENFVMCVWRTPHGTTWNDTSTKEHVMHHESRAALVARRLDMPTV